MTITQGAGGGRAGLPGGVAGAMALAVLVCGCAEGTPGSSREAIIGGEPAPDAAAVVAVVERSARCAPEPALLRCTGALVGPRAVLTAAHCLGDGRPADLAVSFGATAGEGAVVGVTRGDVHPDYDPETRRFDLMVLVLESDAPDGPSPLLLQREALDAAWEGDVVEMLGYGATEPDAVDAGERYRGTARIDGVSAGELRLVADPAMSCRGDSGGPVLSAAGAIVAVTSNGDPACVEHAIGSRVDVATGFLDGAIARSTADPPARRAFDPGEHFCDALCSDDADCPEGMGCHGAPGAPRRCVLPGLAAGELSGACSEDRQCGESPCVVTPAGCQCFLSCGLHSHGRDAGTAGEPGGGGGCSVGARDGARRGWWMVLALLALGRVRDRLTRIP